MTIVRAVASPDLVKSADCFFRNDEIGIFVELIQNARRAGADLVNIHVEELSAEPVESRITVHDNGHGIVNFQNLLTFGESGWSDQTKQREHPAGMGFFSLCHSSVEVSSGHESLSLKPQDFLGGVDIETVPTPDFVPGTRIVFSCRSSLNRLASSIRSASEFCPTEVRLNGVEMPRHDFLEGALYRETIDGIEVGFAGNFRWGSETSDRNWNFYGARLHHHFGGIDGKLIFTERSGWQSRAIYARFNVLNTQGIKVQLPERRAIVADEQSRSFERRARAAAYRYFQGEEKHALPFEDWVEARNLGIVLPEASPLLRTWHAPALDDTSDPFFGEVRNELLETVAQVMLVDDDIEDKHTLEAALQTTAEFDFRLYQQSPQFQGYSWYNGLPLLLDTEVLVDRLPFKAWRTSSLLRPEEIEVAVTITQFGRPDSVQYLPSAIHVLEEEDLEFENGQLKFVAVRNSPWDNESMDGPFDVLQFLIAATFYGSDDPVADSWQTQRDSYEEYADRKVNEYFRGPRAALLALLRDSLSWEVRQYAKQLGVREIRFRDLSPEGTGWDVSISEGTTPPRPEAENQLSSCPLEYLSTSSEPVTDHWLRNASCQTAKGFP